MLKVTDPVRWEAAKAIFAATFSDHQGNPIDSELACVCADEITSSSIKRGWLAEVPDEPEPPTSQWRPIAEADGSEDQLLVGQWDDGYWIKEMCADYSLATQYGFTHYLPIPEPPEREGA